VPEKEILEKAAAAEMEGSRELVLTGIHIGLYGADRGERDGLAGLVETILESTNTARIRLSSVEPMELTDRLLDAVAGNGRVCPHLHVPLQSGCDRTLSRMRRPYDAKKYLDVVSRAACKVANVRIGADVIAGFPGETAADFEETVRFLAGSPVNYLHVFPYSVRTGTESAQWPDDVNPQEKKERVRRLLRLDAKMKAAFLGGQLGRELKVLAETLRPGKGIVTGTSENYVDVGFPGGSEDIGALFRVRAEKVAGSGLAGERIISHV
jgi:threonylcarbamoyladenosine tRNA methylthiotransferase MtaB